MEKFLGSKVTNIEQISSNVWNIDTENREYKFTIHCLVLPDGTILPFKA